MMLLHEILRPELIKVGLEAEKKREAISELMDVLIQYHEIPMNQRDILLEQLYANEDSLGSGMEHGIALPHIATDRVDDVICAVGMAILDTPLGPSAISVPIPAQRFETKAAAVVKALTRAVRDVQALMAG